MESSPETRARAHRALIVEDNNYDAEEIERHLKYLGWEYDRVYSPRDALKILRSRQARKYDAAFVDILFPGDMDGYELEREVLKDEVIQNVPFVFMTGARESLMKTGVGECITHIVKPMSREGIEKALKTCNGKTDAAAPYRPEWQTIGASVIVFLVGMTVGHGLGHGWFNQLITKFVK